MSTFAVADYVVFVISVSISLSIGVFFAYRGRKRQTTEDYLLGNRKMKAFPVAVSIAVSYESAITMLGFPAEAYRFGMVYLWFVLTFPLIFMVGVKVTVPMFQPLKITSIYEYFQMRFKSRTARLVATIVAMIRTVLYMSVVIFGPAIAIEAVTPFPYWCSILLAGVTAVIYTTIGGMKAVIWTDVFQMVIMNTGLIAILIKSAIVSGGLTNVFVVASDQGRLNMDKFKFDMTERTFWTFITGGMVAKVGILFSQVTFQRMRSVPTQKDAEKVMWMAGVIMVVFGTLACLSGTFAFSYFHTIGCDPLASKRIRNSNQIIPLMVAQIFADYPGVIGLFIAALFSATLSTLSSGLNSLAAQTTADFVRPFFKNLSESLIMVTAKISVLIYGAIVIALSFVIANIKGSLVQVFYSVGSTVHGPLIGMFFFSMFCPWANQKGTLVGVLVGTMFVAWITLGQLLSPNLRREQPLPPASTLQCQNNYTITNTTSYTNGYGMVAQNTTVSNSMERSVLDILFSLNYTMFYLIGILVTACVASIVSILTGKPSKEDVDPKYMLPLVDYCCPCLPTKIKQHLYCGVDFYKMDAELEWTLKLDNNDSVQIPMHFNVSDI